MQYKVLKEAAVRELNEEFGGLSGEQWNAMSGNGARQAKELVNSAIADLMQKLKPLIERDNYAITVVAGSLKNAAKEVEAMRVSGFEPRVAQSGMSKF